MGGQPFPWKPVYQTTRLRTQKTSYVYSSFSAQHLYRIFPCYNWLQPPLRAGWIPILFVPSHTLSAERKHELFACFNTSNLSTKQTAEQPLRTAVIQSSLHLLYANSRQSIEVKEVSHPVYLFVVY
jgi:hypothetical protein